MHISMIMYSLILTTHSKHTQIKHDKIYLNIYLKSIDKTSRLSTIQNTGTHTLSQTL